MKVTNRGLRCGFVMVSVVMMLMGHNSGLGASNDGRIQSDWERGTVDGWGISFRTEGASGSVNISSNAQVGGGALEIIYSLPPDSHQITLKDKDWPGTDSGWADYNSWSMWIYGDNSANTLKFKLQSSLDKVVWVYNIPLNFSGWQKFNMLIADFRPLSPTFANLSFDKIKALRISIKSLGNPEPSSGKILIDHIRADKLDLDLLRKEKEKIRERLEKEAEIKVERGMLKYIDLSARANTTTKILYPQAPLGLVILEGIPFKVAERYITVHEWIPALGIVVGKGNVRYLWFLHTCRGTVPAGKLGRYVINFTDDSSEEITLIRGKNIHFIGHRTFEAPLVTEGGLRGFQIYRWKNPYPDKVIASIDVFGGAKYPHFNIHILGITAKAGEGGFTKVSREKIEKLVELRITKEEEKGMILSWEPIDRGKRPFLLFGVNDLPRIRAKAKGELHELYKEYKRRADAGEKGWMTLLAPQWNALVYLVEGDLAYAERAKEFLIASVNRLRRAIRLGEGGIGAVHVGRALRIQSLVYDTIINSGVFSDEEDRQLRKNMAFIAHKLMCKSYFPWDETGWGGNWNIDRFVGVGMFSMVFPDHPKSREWLNHALGQFEVQMKPFIRADGSIPESPRYQGAVLRTLVPFAQAVKRNTGENLFETIKPMLDWFVKVQTPPCALFGRFTMQGGIIRGHNKELMGDPRDKMAVMPGIGNANWVNMWMSALGWAAPIFKDSDPAFAGRLEWAWNRAGQPFLSEFSPGNPLAAFILLSQPRPEAIPQYLKSYLLADIGFAILRSGFDTEDEIYMFFNVGSFMGHAHNDRGSFSLHAYGFPLSLDPGVYCYGISLSAWFDQPKAHNVVTFGPRRLANRAPAKVTTFMTTEHVDFVTGDIPEIGEVSNYTRHMLFVKPDFFVVWDEIKSNIFAEWHFHTPLDKVERVGNKIAFATQKHDVNLDITFLQPNLSPDNLWQGEGEKRWLSDTKRWSGKPGWTRVKQEPAGDFIAILYPHRERELKLLASSDNYAKLKVGRRVTELFFGAQGNFKGRMGIKIRDDHEFVGIYMVDGRVIADGIYSIETDRPLTVSFECQGDGRWLFGNWSRESGEVIVGGFENRVVIFQLDADGNRIRQTGHYSNGKAIFSVAPETLYEIICFSMAIDKVSALKYGLRLDIRGDYRLHPYLYKVSPGHIFNLKLTFKNAGDQVITEGIFSLDSVKEWKIKPIGQVGFRKMKPGDIIDVLYQIAIPPGVPVGDKKLLTGKVVGQIEGKQIIVNSQVGLEVMSRFEMSVEPDEIIFKLPSASQEFRIKLKSNFPGMKRPALVKVTVPDNWETNWANQQFILGKEWALTATVTIPQSVGPGRYKVTIKAQYDGFQRIISPEVIVMPSAKGKNLIGEEWTTVESIQVNINDPIVKEYGKIWNEGNIVSSEDLSATFQVKWDDVYFHMAVRVIDDEVIAPSPIAFLNDGVAVFIYDEDTGNNAVWFFTPTSLDGKPRQYVRVIVCGKPLPTNLATIKSGLTPGGYELVIAIPWTKIVDWANMGGRELQPQVGKTLRFTFLLIDADKGQWSQIMWIGDGANEENFGYLAFADQGEIILSPGRQ